MDLNSLHNRYAVLSIVCGGLLLIAATSVNDDLTHTRNQTTTKIEKHNTILARSRITRKTIWQAREAIGHILIDPERFENQNRILSSQREAINSTEHSIDNHQMLTPKQDTQVQEIMPLPYRLETEARASINIRLDSNRPFPSIALAQTERLLRQRIVFTAFSAAIAESTDDIADEKINIGIHNLLVDVRHRGPITTSIFRILIASRIGSFALDGVGNFINNINRALKKPPRLNRSDAMVLTTSTSVGVIEQPIN